MHVDVDVELARKREDALDLSSRIAVIAGRAADDFCAALEPFDEQLLRSWVVRQTLLRKHADSMSMAQVIGDQRDGLKAAHADAGIHFHLGAHPGGAMQDALDQRALGAHAHVLDRHAFLQRRMPLTGLSACRSCGVQRSMMRDLSRWMCVSIIRDIPGSRLASNTSPRRKSCVRWQRFGLLRPRYPVPSAARSESRALRTISSTRAHFDLDVGGLDQRPPFLDLRLVVGGECGRGLLLGWRRSPGRIRSGVAARQHRRAPPLWRR